MKFIVEKSFWEVFPQAKIGVVICKGLDNSEEGNPKYAKMLEEAAIKAQVHVTNEEFSKNDVIQTWRNAFQQFKTKKGARCSIEALLKRAKNGNSVGSINPLVDIYNAVSLEFGVPCGGEDLSKIVGDIRLTKAIGDEEFITLGNGESEPPYVDEIVYKDDAGVMCRCWNWREAVRTMLTEETKDSFMCIECVNEDHLDRFNNALETLSHKVSECLGADCSIHILGCNHTEIEF